MKVTLHFDVPEEREELELHQRGPAAHAVLSHLAAELRRIRKYEEHGEEASAMADRIETFLFREVAEEGLEI